MISFTYEHNIICSRRQLDDNAQNRALFVQVVICMSRGGFPANEQEEKFALNERCIAMFPI